MELGGRPGRYPSRRELKLIFDFEHFVRCVEHTKSFYKPWEDFSRVPWANTPDLQLDRRRRFYSAMYRVLLAGAVLYRAYNEPLIRGETHGPPNFLRTLNKWLAAWRSGVDRAFRGFSSAEFEYLRKFPIYNLEAHSAKQPYYQGLVEFLENESNIRLRDEGPIAGTGYSSLRDPKLDDLNPLQRIILQETGKFAYAYGLLTNLSTFYANGDGLPTRLVYESDENEVVDFVKRFRAGIAPQFRSASIILLGSFRLYDVRMPVAIEEAKGVCLILNPLNPSFPSFQHLDSLLEKFHQHFDRVHRYHPMDPTPYPPVDFFEYIFRKHLNLRFADDAFSPDGLDTPYDIQIREEERVFVEPMTQPLSGEDLFEYASVPHKRLEDYNGGDDDDDDDE